MKKTKFISSAKDVIDLEIDALNKLKKNINKSFSDAVIKIAKCQSKVILCGVGKSGLIASKIAATLASVGTPSFNLSASEASHGDLGMISKKDILVLISNSGETNELVNLLPVVKRLGIPVVAMTNSASSSLGQHADVILDISVEKEACSLGLAPTTSTTATLVMGDALAVALLDQKGFTSDDFALSHPGGSLGRKLLLKVRDIMLTGSDIPLIELNASVADALLEISKKGLGMTGVLDTDGTLTGVFTDGDLRRILDARIDVHSATVESVMTKGGKTTTAEQLAVEALNLMETHKISAYKIYS